jgi:hypothetical protein
MFRIAPLTFGDEWRLSCPSRSLCVVTDYGSVITSTRPAAGRRAWHHARASSVYSLGAISCPSARLCLALGSGLVPAHPTTELAISEFASHNPAGGASAWHGRRIPGGGINNLTTISCPSVSLCVAGDSVGHVLTTTNPGGGASAWRSSDVSISTVSCPSVSFCVALGNGGVLTSNLPTGGASAWKFATGPANGLSGLSCPTVSLCVAFSGSQILTSTNPAGGSGTWTPQYTDPASPSSCGLGGPCAAISALSCPSATLCVAVDGDGDVLSSTDPTGGASAWSTTTGDPQCTVGASSGWCYGGGGVSCPSASFCVVSDGRSVLTSSNPASGPWETAPSSVAPAIFAGSCPTNDLCVGASGADLLLSTDPASGSWTTSDTVHFPSLSVLPIGAPYTNLPVRVTGVSCPSVSLCIAIDGLGRVTIGKG